ncbi:MAG: hypothetical protein M1524_03435 [Patescibacteria group bacterium]|nr:hypothetical protein [Patescibacteria group bacterium]
MNYTTPIAMAVARAETIVTEITASHPPQLDGSKIQSLPVLQHSVGQEISIFLTKHPPTQAQLEPFKAQSLSSRDNLLSDDLQTTARASQEALENQGRSPLSTIEDARVLWAVDQMLHHSS